MSVSNLHEVVYTPESQLRKPNKLLRSMARDLIASRELAWRLFVRDVSARYRQTALGYFWAVFPPLVTSLVFVLLNSSKMLRVEETGIPYPAYVIMGTVFFGLFVDALNAPLRMVSSSRGMLVKINFPREGLLLAALARVLLDFGIKLVLLAATLVIFQVAVHPTVLFASVPLIGLLLLGTMLGVLLVPLGMLFRDITYGLTVVTTGLMFLTPVAYPSPTGGPLAVIIAYNPLTPLLMSARELVVMGPSTYTAGMLVVMLVTLVLLFAGWVLFRLALPIIIERLGA